MNHFHWIYAIILTAFLNACSSRTAPDHARPKTLALTQGRSATAPYFTSDPNGMPVLCWTEATGTDGTYRLAFARYDTISGDFSTPVAVAGSEGISTAPESMGKIAFKDDGTLVAVFAKPFPQEKNPFAGAIYYSLSADGGASWSPPSYLHADTAHQYGRNFFDIARLKNGEIGAVWLDGRDKSIEGSTLYFASTTPGGGFTDERVLHRGTCECCRTDLLVDTDGTLHVAYRSLMHPAALFGQEARDIAYVQSKDHGKTFSDEIPISVDNWAIQACPHTGPTLAADENDIHAVWFTAGGDAGLYYTHKSSTDTLFNKRKLLTATGSHPQSLAWRTGIVLTVYEDGLTPPAQGAHGGTHDHGSHAQGTAAMRSHILLHPIKNGHPADPIPLSLDDAYHHHPVITQADGKVWVAWASEHDGRSSIVYQSVTKNTYLCVLEDSLPNEHANITRKTPHPSTALY